MIDLALVGLVAAAALLVAPVSGHAALGVGVHLVRADLDLDRLAAGAEHGGMDRAIEVVFRGGDVIVELARNELPQRVHDAERRVAFGHRVDQHARRADVHDLLERELLRLHLAPDAVDVLRPSIDPRLDARRPELALEAALELLDVALAFGAAHLERRGDVPILGGLQVAKREILELPFHLPYAQTVGERGVDLARHDGELAFIGAVETSWLGACAAMLPRA